MRIYKWDEFLRLPEGTFFCSPLVGGKTNGGFKDLSIKGESQIEDDFKDSWYLELSSFDSWNDEEHYERLDEMMEDNKISYPIRKAQCRLAMYGKEPSFLVWEKSDLEFLKEAVEEALKLCEKKNV